MKMNDGEDDGGFPKDALAVWQTPGLTRAVVADATQAARDLASNHLAGPAASRALAEGLVAVSLLSADLGTPQEAATFQLSTDGPIGSLLVEATFEGTLRGYTAKKILNDFDGAPGAGMDAVFGAMGVCNVMVSLPGKVLSQSGARVPGPRPGRALEAYYLAGAQREVKVRVDVAADADGRIALARGALVERMPGSDPAEFAAFGRDVGMDALMNSPAPDGAGVRPLRFACRCSYGKALATLRALPADERRELAARGTPVDIYCHMCGKCHSVKPEDIQVRDADFEGEPHGRIDIRS